MSVALAPGSVNSLALLDRTIYLRGSTDWYSISLDDFTTTDLAPGPNDDSPYSIAYDDRYLYFNHDGVTLRGTSGDLSSAARLCDDMSELRGRIHGDYLYAYEIDALLFRRCPKSGGTFEDLITLPAPFKSWIGKGDALYGLTQEGELHRVRSADDDVVIAHFPPQQSMQVSTDGTHVYVGSGFNENGSFFRIVE
jgi:hypothetical protein